MVNAAGGYATALRDKRALILLGGLWHDFDGFAAAMQGLLEPHGVQVQATYDLDSLSHLEETKPELILSFTCFSPHREGFNDTSPLGLTDAQIDGLTQWVRRGGALLAVHCATVCGESGPGLGELFGGVFVSHPPQFTFTVYPVYEEEHPITAGIESFAVHDEFYMETHRPNVQVHMVGIDRGLAYPMAWSKGEGLGRVVHIAPGHSNVVWELATYQRLILQSIGWLLEVK